MSISSTDRETVRWWLADHGVSCPTTEFLDAIIRLLRGLYRQESPCD